jgi:phage gp29-like protein
MKDPVAVARLAKKISPRGKELFFTSASALVDEASSSPFEFVVVVDDRWSSRKILGGRVTDRLLDTSTFTYG